jgi:hypothetical protein
MPKKIATLLLSIAAIAPMALPVQAATTADPIDASSNITMDGKSNLISRRNTKLSRREIGRRTRARIGCGRVQDPCFNPRVFR